MHMHHVTCTHRHARVRHCLFHPHVACTRRMRCSCEVIVRSLVYVRCVHNLMPLSPPVDTMPLGAPFILRVLMSTELTRCTTNDTPVSSKAKTRASSSNNGYISVAVLVVSPYPWMAGACGIMGCCEPPGPGPRLRLGPAHGGIQHVLSDLRRRATALAASSLFGSTKSPIERILVCFKRW